MDKIEFLLIIPAIIYGVAIVDLLKIFSHKKNYFELVGWGVFCLTAIVISWSEIYNKVDLIKNDNISFYVLIIQSIIVARIAAVITPEEKHINTKKYFMGIKRNFFLLLALSAFINLLSQYFVFNDHSPIYIRPILILIMLSCAYYDKVWYRTTILSLLFLLAGIIMFSKYSIFPR